MPQLLFPRNYPPSFLCRLCGFRRACPGALDRPFIDRNRVPSTPRRNYRIYGAVEEERLKQVHEEPTYRPFATRPQDSPAKLAGKRMKRRGARRPRPRFRGKSACGRPRPAARTGEGYGCVSRYHCRTGHGIMIGKRILNAAAEVPCPPSISTFCKNASSSA